MAFAECGIRRGRPDRPLAPVAIPGQARRSVQHFDRFWQLRRSGASHGEGRRGPPDPDTRSESLRDAMRGLEMLAGHVRREQVQRQRAEESERAGDPLEMLDLLRLRDRFLHERNRAVVVAAAHEGIRDDEAQERLARAPPDLARDTDRACGLELLARESAHGRGRRRRRLIRRSA